MEGPFILINLAGETCTVQCPDGQKVFCSTVVNLYNKKEGTLVGSGIELYWTHDKKLYTGTITDFNTESGWQRVEYDDGENKDTILQKRELAHHNRQKYP